MALQETSSTCVDAKRPPRKLALQATLGGGQQLGASDFVCIVLYSEKLLKEKTLANWREKKPDFRGENFCGLLPFAAPTDAMPPNFTEKTMSNCIEMCSEKIVATVPD